MKAKVLFVSCLFVLTGSLLAQQQGTLKIKKKQTVKRHQSVKEKAQKGKLVVKAQSEKKDMDFYRVRFRNEQDDLLQKLMFKKKAKVIVRFSKGNEVNLFEGFNGYGANALRPFLELNTVSIIDANKRMQELLRSFAKEKKFQIISKMDSLDDKSSSFFAIPRKVTENDLKGSALVSPASIKNFGVPELEIYNYAISVGYRITITNDLHTVVSLNALAYWIVAPAPGSKYEENFFLSAVNDRRYFPELVHASTSKSDFATFQSNITLDDSSFRVGSTGKIEISFLKDFGGFLEREGIKNNCFNIDFARKQIVEKEKLKEKKARTLNVFISAKLITMHTASVYLMNSKQFVLTIDPEENNPKKKCTINISDIQHIDYDNNFLDGCSVDLFLKEVALKNLPVTIPIKKKLFSKKKFIRIYSHDSTGKNACVFLDWLMKANVKCRNTGIKP